MVHLCISGALDPSSRIYITSAMLTLDQDCNVQYDSVGWPSIPDFLASGVHLRVCNDLRHWHTRHLRRARFSRIHCWTSYNRRGSCGQSPNRNRAGLGIDGRKETGPVHRYTEHRIHDRSSIGSCSCWCSGWTSWMGRCTSIRPIQSQRLTNMLESYFLAASPIRRGCRDFDLLPHPEELYTWDEIHGR